jgi:hypothetical protein
MYYLFNEIETQSGLESSLEIALIVTDINRVRARIAWSAELQSTNLSDLYFNLISKCSISNSTEQKRNDIQLNNEQNLFKIQALIPVRKRYHFEDRFWTVSQSITDQMMSKSSQFS